MTRLGRTVALLKAIRPEAAPDSRPGRFTAVDGFGSNPGGLTMRLHVPLDRKPGAALVVVLHGCTQSAADYADPVGWLDLADRAGFAVLAPEQARANNANLCFNWFEPQDARRGRGEAESIAQMIAHAVRTCDLDPTRVFITGLSAGGAMASVMLAAYPQIFAGGAIVAGLPFGVAASLPQALQAMSMTSPPAGRTLGDAVRRETGHPGPWPPVSVWHGQADAVVKPAAGEAVAAQWRDVHGAVGPGRRARTPDGREFLVWLSPDGEPVVELHRITGLGHGAPVRAGDRNGCGRASRYTPETGISSTFEIAQGWGLVEREAAEPHERPRAAADRTESRPGALRPPTASTGVAEVIDDALRSAGLLR